MKIPATLILTLSTLVATTYASPTPQSGDLNGDSLGELIQSFAGRSSSVPGYALMKRGLFGPSDQPIPKSTAGATDKPEEAKSATPASIPDGGEKLQSTRSGFEEYKIMKRGLFGPSDQSIPKSTGGATAEPASTSDVDKLQSTRPGFDEYKLMKRDINPHVDAIVDAIVNVNTKIVIKALLDLKVQLAADIRTKVTVLTTGLLATKSKVLVPKISSRVDAETNAAINSKVDTDAKVMVLDNIHDHAVDSILKRCPKADDECILKNTNDIVADVEALVKVDVEHLFVALKLNLMTHVRAHVAVTIRELGINLFLEHITIQGDVDAVAELDLHLSMCSHIIVKGLDITVIANAIAVIKGILNN
ncbi:hypothetical protein BGZ76_010319 [Entomortierella beljakovae]|nr:hypothetical protein BGZ76_010319 [Entomortierella beljakovae]